MHYEALEVKKRAYGMDHPSTAFTLNNIALVLWTKDKNSAEAARLGRQALAIAERALGREHPTTQQYRREWA